MYKTIIFCSQVDLFVDNGGAYSNRAQLDAFLELGYEVTLIIPFTNSVIPDFYKENAEIVLVPERSVVSKCVGFLKGKVHRFSPFVERWYEKVEGKKKYDFIYITGGLVSGDLAPFFQSKNLNVITLHNNIELHYYIDDRNIITLWGLTSFWVKKKERTALLSSSLNFTVTNRDLQSFKLIYNLPASIHIAYWGCYEYKDKNTPVIEDKKDKDIYRILIMGTLKDPQTYLSILGIKDILKSFVHDNYAIEVVLAGKKPPKLLYDVFGNVYGFRIIDTPENMEEIIVSADLLLNPVKYGSGLKLRNMDALRCGIPCLVHEVSANGYESLKQYDFMKIYTTEKELYNALTEMREKTWSRKGIAEVYNQYFSFMAGVGKLGQLLGEL